VFTLIFVGLMVAGWLFLSFLPWLVWSVVTRGNAGLVNLPLCLFAGVVAGLAVPILVRDDEWGLVWSGLAAVFVPFGLLVVRNVIVPEQPRGTSSSQASADEAG
jgi:hypothetical protein